MSDVNEPRVGQFWGDVQQNWPDHRQSRPRGLDKNYGRFQPTPGRFQPDQALLQLKAGHRPKAACFDQIWTGVDQSWAGLDRNWEGWSKPDSPKFGAGFKHNVPEATERWLTCVCAVGAPYRHRARTGATDRFASRHVRTRAGKLGA